MNLFRQNIWRISRGTPRAKAQDLSAILGVYKAEQGQPPHDPDMLLLCDYSRSVYSSRQLARACEEWVDVMAVTGLNRPDFRTISDFRKPHLIVLSDLFVPANVDDRAEVGRIAEAILDAIGQNVTVAFVDQSHTGSKSAAAVRSQGIELEVVKLSEAKRASAKTLGRRENIRLGNSFSRASEDYERYASALAGLHVVAFVCIMLAKATSLIQSAERPHMRAATGLPVHAAQPLRATSRPSTINRPCSNCLHRPLLQFNLRRRRRQTIQSKREHHLRQPGRRTSHPVAVYRGWHQNSSYSRRRAPTGGTKSLSQHLTARMLCGPPTESRQRNF